MRSLSSSVPMGSLTRTSAQCLGSGALSTLDRTTVTRSPPPPGPALAAQSLSACSAIPLASTA